MKAALRIALVLAQVLTSALSASAKPAAKPIFAMHGGAGTLSRAEMTPELERAYREMLERALVAGHEILKRGGASLDAVEAGIRVLEDSPLFNAGKGAAFTHEGRNELDAAIMDGRTLRAGAVASVTIVKNPIRAARAVMERSPHVLLVGRGADLFATQAGLEIVDPGYFWTERRWKALQRELQKEKEPPRPGKEAPRSDGNARHGTVGAVALDQRGDLAAGTSTGGLTNKLSGRVGDSPIIGAGTYADNGSVAISCTGDGEHFIRLGVAHEVAALVRYRGLSVAQAGDELIHRRLTAARGEGGAVILDGKGELAFPFNSPGMYRGWIGADGVPHVAIYKE
jgi:L-asparaginase / beta-aspartyl-peptidase